MYFTLETLGLGNYSCFITSSQCASPCPNAIGKKLTEGCHFQKQPFVTLNTEFCPPQVDQLNRSAVDRTFALSINILQLS